MPSRVIFPKKLVLEYLDACTIACRHCITHSAPGLKVKLPLEATKEIITECAGQGFLEVNLTGGEPFLVYAEMRELIRHTKRLGMKFTVTSNAHWATNVEIATARLIPLFEDGLDQLHLSYDRPHHDEGIPVERIDCGVLAAKKIGLAVQIWLAFFKNDSFLKEIKTRLKSHRVPFRLSNVLPMARGNTLPAELIHTYSWMSQHNGCKTLGFLVITPNGNCYACCNAAAQSTSQNPLFLGNILKTPAREIIKTKERRLPLHGLISYFGPGALYKLLPEPLREGLRPEMHPCLFCTEMLNDGNRADYLLRAIRRTDKRIAEKKAVVKLIRSVGTYKSG